MDWLAQLFSNTNFLGIKWHPWKFVGWVGNIVFFSRFFVQWWATEKQKQVVIPNAFWWLSLVGSLCLLAYGLWRRDSVLDRKSTRLNSSHSQISYAVFCLKKK